LKAKVSLCLNTAPWKWSLFYTLSLMWVVSAVELGGSVYGSHFFSQAVPVPESVRSWTLRKCPCRPRIESR
jgi:hypothetical protein